MESDKKCEQCSIKSACAERQIVVDSPKENGKGIKKHRHAIVERLLFTPLELLEKTETDRLPLNADDIVAMLDDKGRNHREGYSLYTTMAALNGIFSTRKIHLTRASEMNDQEEFIRFDKRKWRRIFMACFSIGKTESMGMWSMYGGSSQDSVRLHFPYDFMKERFEFWNSEQEKALSRAEKQSDNSYNYFPVENVKWKLTLHDVIYWHKGKNGYGSIRWHGKYAGPKRAEVFCNPLSCPKFTSYVKDAPWEYENEVRLVLEVEENLPKEWKTLALDLGPTLDKLTVVLGPCNSKETKVRDVFKQHHIKSAKKITQSELRVRYKDE